MFHRRFHSWTSKKGSPSQVTKALVKEAERQARAGYSLKSQSVVEVHRDRNFGIFSAYTQLGKSKQVQMIALFERNKDG